MTILVWAIHVLLLYSANAHAQEITPENIIFNRNLIKSEQYTMIWYSHQDTSKTEIGRVKTEIKKLNKKILVITTVVIHNATSSWIDTTIAQLKNLKPIYHSSYNQQRDMRLYFGKTISGYYFDKKTNTKTQISETVEGSYFDSNLYPQLLRWLPLKNKYHPQLSIFDYNPKAKIGKISASVKNVSEESLVINGQSKTVWKVLVTDDISDNKVINTYFIDSKSRSLLKQIIEIQGRRMTMELN